MNGRARRNVPEEVSFVSTQHLERCDNNERLHLVIGYKAPKKVYGEWKESIIEKR